MADLSEFKTNATAPVVIVSPRTGAATEFVITIHGVYSQRFRGVYQDFLRRTPEDQPRTLGDLDPKALAALTEAWTGLERDGEAVAFTPSDAEDIYSGSPFVTRQLIQVITAGSDFLPEA